MDAYPSEAANILYTDLPPILVAASSGSAMRRAEATVSASGLRIGAKLPVEDALARLKAQPSATSVWVELDRDCGEEMDELLTQLTHDVGREFYTAVVSITPALVDPISARVDDAIDVIVEADDVERTAALAVAIGRRATPSDVWEVGRDRSADRLRQLSEEVSRIASTLARLSAGPSENRPAVRHIPVADLPPLSADSIRQIIRARRLRTRFFAEELFADPAWDMMLDLLQAEIAQLRVPVSSLCIAAAVPATTALRWLKTLVSQGLFIRRPDPHDGRRVYVELAADASHALRSYFAEVGQAAAI
jgi:DNA-binding MarR family transcriptional regulator